MILRHEFLVQGADAAACRRRVLAFFDGYLLIRYDRVEVEAREALTATTPAFWPRIEQGAAVNRETVASFFQELGREGVATLDDLARLPQGYRTSLLHTACHLLDGFFGIDSFFYNLEEDAHWISPGLRQKIMESPGHFFLLPVVATLSGTRRGDDEAQAQRRLFRDGVRRATRKNLP